MSVTVQELLKLPIMQENSKVVSEYGLDNIVRYVTVAEAHDVHFPSFGGGVFVLTTLSAHHGSTEEIDEFIQGLCNVKGSGIGIKLGRFVNEIPASTIRLAREANVPIVALSSTVYFREILSDTLSVITGNQQQMLNRINALSRTMVNAIVENQNIQQLLRLFCQEVNCYCCCMDLSGRWIAEAASLCGVFDTKEVKRELENYIAQQGQVRQYYHKGNIFIFPCIVQGEFLAAFCMAAYDVEEELACSLAQSVVNGINIKFLGENLKQQAEMELISSTLDDVLFSHGSDPKIIAERLSLVDFVPRKNLLMILVSSEAAQRYARSYMHTLNGIQSVFSERFASCVTFRHSNKFLVLLVMNVVLLIVGMFLEGGAALIILAPLMVPIVKAAGIDLVHFGIVCNVNIMIGGLTPPFGSMMFTCVSITGCKMQEFIKECVPFIIALLIALLLLTYIPGISMLIPNLIY